MTATVGQSETVTSATAIHSIRAFIYRSINTNGLVMRIAIVVPNGNAEVDLILQIFAVCLVHRAFDILV